MEIGIQKLREHLELLSKITPNHTLNVTTMTIVPHNTYMGAAKRLWFRENREKTIDTIEKIIDTAIVNLPREFDLFILIKNAKNGIHNLKETYGNDQDIKLRIESCLTRIDNVCTRFEHRLITNIEQIPIIIATELASQVNLNEYDDVVLVRQTPISSPPVQTPKTPGSAKESPITTPLISHTPQETPPPTPSSTPTRDLSPSRDSFLDSPNLQIHQVDHIHPNLESEHPKVMNSEKTLAEKYPRINFGHKTLFRFGPRTKKPLKMFPKISNHFSFTDPSVSMALKLGPLFRSPFMMTNQNPLLPRKTHLPKWFDPNQEFMLKSYNPIVTENTGMGNKKSYLNMDVD